MWPSKYLSWGGYLSLQFCNQLSLKPLTEKSDRWWRSIGKCFSECTNTKTKHGRVTVIKWCNWTLGWCLLWGENAITGRTVPASRSHTLKHDAQTSIGQWVEPICTKMAQAPLRFWLATFDTTSKFWDVIGCFLLRGWAYGKIFDGTLNFKKNCRRVS